MLGIPLDELLEDEELEEEDDELELELLEDDELEELELLELDEELLLDELLEELLDELLLDELDPVGSSPPPPQAISTDDTKIKGKNLYIAILRLFIPDFVLVDAEALAVSRRLFGLVASNHNSYSIIEFIYPCL